MTTLKFVAEDVLENDLESRDNNNWLVVQTWKALGFDVPISFEQCKEMPSCEAITRIRRSLQEKGKCPSSSKVKEIRVIKETQYRERYSRKHKEVHYSVNKNSHMYW